VLTASDTMTMALVPTSSPRTRTWAGAIGLTLLIATAIALAVVAFVMAPELYPLTVHPQDDAAARAAREGARTTAITTTRASILAALAGVGAFISISINYRNSAIANRNSAIATETLRVTERGHLTDRYAKAIELLGDERSIAIRLGGIYALQQYAVDSNRPEDQLTVVEVLSAFVRLNLPGKDVVGAPLPTGPVEERSEEPTLTEEPGDNSASTVTSARQPHPPPADVLAAISVLAQLPDRDNLMRADFAGVDFAGVDLSEARLLRGNLHGTHLRGAFLRGADLTEAFLYGADLGGADLRGTFFNDADLRLADLSSADLRGAVLVGADLRGADFWSADLSSADLRRADLSATVLSQADLRDARFSPGQLDPTHLAFARNVEAAKIDGDATQE
jgi:hypothetical protein